MVHRIFGCLYWSLSEVGKMMIINFIVNFITMSGVDKLVALLQDIETKKTKKRKLRK